MCVFVCIEGASVPLDSVIRLIERSYAAAVCTVVAMSLPLHCQFCWPRRDLQTWGAVFEITGNMVIVANLVLALLGFVLCLAFLGFHRSLSKAMIWAAMCTWILLAVNIVFLPAIQSA